MDQPILRIKLFYKRLEFQLINIQLWKCISNPVEDSFLLSTDNTIIM